MLERLIYRSFRLLDYHLRMADELTQPVPHPGLPSRTSILVAAARAFGSRDPDAGVRNPDFLADTLIGPDELALISDHPLSTVLTQDYAEASQNPAVVMLASLMILRTRFIDIALKRAVEDGATQIVILGAGFDSRAYRFRELLKYAHVIEVDAKPTQEYKKQRIQKTLGEGLPNLTYVSIDFARDDVRKALQAGGFREGAKTFYIWEGVSMYLPEKSVCEMLQLVASHSAPGSSIVLDYANSLGIELTKLASQGPVGIAASWGEPWIFGVPGANGEDFFRELGFDPGVPLSMYNPEVMKRYAVRADGTTYAAHVIEKARAEAQARNQAGNAPQIPAGLLEAQKAIAAAGGVYWLTELTVPAASNSTEVV
ncbi:SAM-dependent methyltransferase [Granulicella mallensis]|uniref:S-adenosyl-L-methionine-dependent methyltransferase n=1 Tax=Granulicella mallensis TaxID=940614 RepID=A0A7W8E8C4_9BACT|nr:SAM-dependent methyltransferase [Granulicella mallensis]MBB5063228.1 methyltransferase (TIGR00027 family) [Granulicella mallensis]